MVSEKIFLFFLFDCKAKVANELLGGALFGPSGVICMQILKLLVLWFQSLLIADNDALGWSPYEP